MHSFAHSRIERNTVFNLIIIWFVTLCSLRFFDFVSITLGKAVVLFSVILIITFLFIHITYNPLGNIKRHFTLPILLILFALLISSFAAVFFYEQQLLVTLYAQFTFYTILFYFLLGKLNPDPDKIIKMILWLGYIYSAIYFLQWLIYPTELVTSRMIVDRGTLRIMLPGAEYMAVSWLILINRYLKTRKFINIIGLLPFIVILILLATRQVLAAIALVTIIFVLMSRQQKSKLTVIILIVLATIPFYFMFKEVFDEMINVSQKQQGKFEQSIRLLAAKYFLFDFNKNPTWVFTGNGYPAPHSSYEVFLDRVSNELGYYQSDIGLIGDFSKFGILYIVGVIMALFKLLLHKYDENYMFIKYTALMMLMTFFTGSGLRSGIIIQLCLLFYLVDKTSRSVQQKEKLKE